MNAIIGADVCRTCTKSYADDISRRFCRAKPPTLVATIGSAPLMKGKEPVIDAKGAPVFAVTTTGYQSAFPRVEDDWWCADHSRLAVRNGGLLT